MSGGEPLLGRVLAGRFRITGFIGEGAMASVFRGVDMTQVGPAADVAVKVMHPHLSGDPTFTGRFRLEARAAARLQHPNSVRIVDCGEDARLFYIAMELIQGRDLAEILTLERRLSPARACRLLTGVTDALATAHAQSIVHRDLKPENVMVVENHAAPGGETVKVLDFGIAKLLDAPLRNPGDTDGPSSALTRVGTVVGTPAYMSPEQCRGQPVDGRSDLYTCGVLLYQLVSGKVPFWSDNPFEIAAKQVREVPVPPSQLVDGLDPALEAIILRALSKKPEERFARAEEMRDAIAALEPRLGDQRLAPRIAGRSLAPPRPTPSPLEARADVPAPGGPGPLAGSMPGPSAAGPHHGSHAGPMPGPPAARTPSSPSSPSGHSGPHALPGGPGSPGSGSPGPGSPGPGSPEAGRQLAFGPLPPREAASGQAVMAGAAAPIDPGSLPTAPRPPSGPLAGSLESRPRGGTIPMGGGLDDVVRQIHEEAARSGLSGNALGSAMARRESIPPGPLAGPIARPRDDRRVGPSKALVAALVMASIAFGVGAGALAWALSR